MKAVMCTELGGPEKLVVSELPSPRAGAGEVVISVHAAGVNFPELLLIAGKYQARPELPFVPGMEVAGIISETGPGVKHLEPGQRVAAHNPFGGYAEEVVVPAHTVIPLTEDASFEDAAGMIVTYGTAHHALGARAALKAGENLLVLGAAGGVGIAAVQVGKAMGARVIAAASSAEKLALARENGADEVIDYSSENLKERVRALTGGDGADVIYDPVGGDIFDSAVRAVAWDGRYLVIGFASGRIPKLAANLPLLKSWRLVGVFWGAFAVREPEANATNFREIMAWYAEGRIKPHVGATYPLEHAAEALAAMRDRKAMGKIILTTGR